MGGFGAKPADQQAGKSPAYPAANQEKEPEPKKKTGKAYDDIRSTQAEAVPEGGKKGDDQREIVTLDSKEYLLPSGLIYSLEFLYFMHFKTQAETKYNEYVDPRKDMLQGMKEDEKKKYDQEEKRLRDRKFENFAKPAEPPKAGTSFTSLPKQTAAGAGTSSLSTTKTGMGFGGAQQGGMAQAPGYDIASIKWPDDENYIIKTAQAFFKPQETTISTKPEESVAHVKSGQKVETEKPIGDEITDYSFLFEEKLPQLKDLPNPVHDRPSISIKDGKIMLPDKPVIKVDELMMRRNK